MNSCTKEYACHVDCRREKRNNGLVDVYISKSPVEYIKRLAASGRCKPVACIDNNMDIRYAQKNTPTTRRTTYDNSIRRYY